MKEVGGWFLPDHEKHLGEWMAHAKNKTQIEDGRVMYQAVKQRAAMTHCQQFRVALDVGGHCGLWAHYLSQKFETLHAFEPVAEHRECFAVNVKASNVTLHPVALGAKPGRISMFTENGSSGNSHVSGEGEIEMRTLDSYGFKDVDFIKIDCEGFELYVLQGAVETLKRCKPVLIVEQKPHVIGNFGFTSPEAITFLQAQGATVLQELSGDYILGF